LPAEAESPTRSTSVRRPHGFGFHHAAATNAAFCPDPLNSAHVKPGGERIERRPRRAGRPVPRHSARPLHATILEHLAAATGAAAARIRLAGQLENAPRKMPVPGSPTVSALGSGLQNSILAEQGRCLSLTPPSAKIEFCKPDPPVGLTPVGQVGDHAQQHDLPIFRTP